jgi:hypothetical protein
LAGGEAFVFEGFAAMGLFVTTLAEDFLSGLAIFLAAALGAAGRTTFFGAVFLDFEGSESVRAIGLGTIRGMPVGKRKLSRNQLPE